MSGISKTIAPVLHTIEVTFATHGTWSDEPNMTLNDHCQSTPCTGLNKTSLYTLVDNIG